MTTYQVYCLAYHSNMTGRVFDPCDTGEEGAVAAALASADVFSSAPLRSIRDLTNAVLTMRDMSHKGAK